MTRVQDQGPLEQLISKKEFADIFSKDNIQNRYKRSL